MLLNETNSKIKNNTSILLILKHGMLCPVRGISNVFEATGYTNEMMVKANKNLTNSASLVSGKAKLLLSPILHSLMEQNNNRMRFDTSIITTTKKSTKNVSPPKVKLQ